MTTTLSPFIYDVHIIVLSFMIQVPNVLSLDGQNEYMPKLAVETAIWAISSNLRAAARKFLNIAKLGFKG